MIRNYAVAAAVAAVFTIHVVCTAAYLLAQNPMTRYYIGPVTQYMEPLFAQRWLLFAPEPATNSLQLWSRYECDGRWTGWRDPAGPVLETHRRNRFSPAGKLLYISNNLARDLSRESAETALRLHCGADPRCEARRNAEVLRSASFRRALAYGVRNSPCAAPSFVRLMVIQVYPTQFSERMHPKPFSFANIFEFDPVPVGASSAKAAP
ncbi:MAG TPA: DUF5819 family protein [Thermoanaerobaculia bacterium]|jgi:hypothetical protein|nr:DUF5819 family protein [Thermoanaerobaculia bacterium]